MAGSIGGYNAHAANIVSAIFIATGQVCVHVVPLIKWFLCSAIAWVYSWCYVWLTELALYHSWVHPSQIEWIL